MASTQDTGGRPRSRRSGGEAAEGSRRRSAAGRDGGAGRAAAAAGEQGGSRGAGATRTVGERDAAPGAAARRITNPLNAGPGILQKMQQLGDHPIRDAEFLRNGDGTQVEQCWGTKGLYVASNASGNWEVAGPFGGGA